MIKDPSYWRRELIKTAEQLERRQHQMRWNEISFSRTEQSVMIAFYGIRKMLEARKASPRVCAASVRCLEYPRRPNSGAEVISPILQAYFDLNHPRKRDRDLLFVCHQVVHSYIFSIAVGYSSGFEGIYFASDRLRSKCLFFVGARTLIKVFRMVGIDSDTGFSPWVEERLPYHWVQTAFPQPNPA
ncbi:MAG: hypothetical protein AB1473_00475 [Thermodesulfobacteriota bacterium]